MPYDSYYVHAYSVIKLLRNIKKFDHYTNAFLSKTGIAAGMTITARLINLFDLYIPERTVAIPPAALDHMACWRVRRLVSQGYKLFQGNSIMEQALLFFLPLVQNLSVQPCAI
jgi:hypothetical protein